MLYPHHYTPHLVALTTIADVKTLLGMDTGVTTYDAQLTAWITSVGKIIRQYLGQPIEQTTLTNELLSGNGKDTLTPGYCPISSLSALSYRTDVATWTAISSTTYALVGNSIYLPTGFDRGIGNYRATFAVGYASGDVPEDVKEVARDMVALRVLDAGLAGGGRRFAETGRAVTVPQGGGFNQTYKDLTPQHEAVLRRYRFVSGV